MLSWQYMDIYIYTCIPAHLWTYSVKGNLWCLQPDPPRHGHCNVSFCLSVTLHSNGKIPGFHRLSYTEFSACPTWLLKKKLSDCLSKGLCMHCTSILSMFLYDSLLSVYPQWPGVYFSRYQLWMGLFALVFLDNSNTVSLSDMHCFRKTVLLIVGCVASLCVGFSLVLVSMGHN